MYKSVEKTLREDASEAELQEQVREIARLARPQWQTEKLAVKRYDNGYTNLLFACGPETGSTEKVCVRLNGAVEKVKSHEAEITDLCDLHKCGLASAVYLKFSNGLCYGYQAGETADELQLIDPLVSDSVARKMAQMHVRMSACKIKSLNNVPPQHSDTFLVQALPGFLDNFPDKFDDPQKQELFKAVFPDKQSIISEAEQLLQHLQSLKADLAFCHNDLLSGNIILHEGEAHFIDYEFAGWNYAAFDIADYFVEFAGILPRPDHSRYPNREFQLRFLTTYLAEKQRQSCLLAGQALTEAKVDSEQLQRLFVHVQHFSVMTHLFWSLWVLLSAYVRQDCELNLLGYAADRFQEYRRCKDVRLALIA